MPSPSDQPCPQQQCPHLRSAQQLAAEGDFRAARDDLLMAVSDDPNNAYAWGLLSEVYEASGELFHAAEAARQAARSAPAVARWQLLKARMVQLEDRADEALCAFDRALALEAKCAEAHAEREALMAKHPIPARLHAYFGGEVQGVFFRKTALQHAKAAKLTGWVRNLEDGRVELVAEGGRVVLARLLAAVVAAKQDNIERIVAHWETPTHEFSDFVIKK